MDNANAGLASERTHAAGNNLAVRQRTAGVSKQRLDCSRRLSVSPFLSKNALFNALASAAVWIAFQPILLAGDRISGDNKRTFNEPEVAQSDKRIEVEKKPESAEIMLRDNRVSGPYCGINSLYICLSAVGIQVQPEQLVSLDYVGSFQGSSVKELVKAAEDFGANAECFSHVTHRELRRVNTPMILHMRRNWADGEYDHWVAFLGCEGDRIRIADAPHPLQAISAAELLANWDGTAIAIANGAVEHSFLWDARLDYFLNAGLLVLALYVAKTVVESERRVGGPLSAKALSVATHAGVIVGFALTVAIGYHSICEVGFLKNPSAVAEVKRRGYSIDIPELTIGQTKAEIDSSHPLVIDARRAIDFRHGAVPGAVNMPVNSSLAERKYVLAGTSREKRIIVYCQSRGCRYADEVATFLRFNGYDNLAIYREGFREWQTLHSASP